jgi:antitoxin (DNA-binding transcriptional repressor) of toxin-antitoxin stability system
MQSITLRQLRDTRQVKAWLKAGVHIEVRERNEVIGDLVPRTPPTPNPVEWPDFAARRRAIFGDYVFPENIVVEARKDSRY